MCVEESELHAFSILFHDESLLLSSHRSRHYWYRLGRKLGGRDDLEKRPASVRIRVSNLQLAVSDFI